MRRLVRKKRLKFSIITAIIIVASFCAYYFYHREQAQALVNFKPGNIMSDYVMSNYTTMTEAQIQAFLKSKNHCNDRDTNKAKRYPNIRYNIRDGHFVCMADDLFDGESAAHIIWQAAQDYRINPQVLLVLLEKEQSLVTDTWPNHIQYRTATGFGCPDTAPCDAQYYGLKNQVRLAAKLFRSVLDGGWSNYPVGNNFIQYNPNKACGGSNVYIENRATSALYRYTPYQPNAGALAAGWGQAYCGAYGNRNFYLYFKKWFGSTQDAVKASPLNVSSSDEFGQRFIGDKLKVSFTVKNDTKTTFHYDYIGIAARDALSKNIDYMLRDVTLRPGESKLIEKIFDTNLEGEYQFFLSSIAKGENIWRPCELNYSQDYCFNKYVVQSKPIINNFTVSNGSRTNDLVEASYSIANTSQYKTKVAPIFYELQNGNVRRNTQTTPITLDKNEVRSFKQIMPTIHTPANNISYKMMNAGQEKTTLQFNVKPALTLTQGLTLSNPNPRVNEPVTASFKIKNHSNRDIYANELICFIVRDEHNGNHDFGCMEVGTVPAGQEKTFSRTAPFTKSGKFRAFFSTFKNQLWHDYDVRTPETGQEKTTLQFNVKPALTLTQGLTLSNPNPRVNEPVTASFKIKNHSNRDIYANELICFIVRDEHNGNHDFGCMEVGTVPAGQEKTFSRTAPFTKSGKFRAFFSTFKNQLWHDYDVRTPETGQEKTTLQFNVKP